MRTDNIVHHLIALAEDNIKLHPQMKSFHAAAIVRNGGKVINYAVNQPRSYTKGKSCMTIHAEEAAVLRLFGPRLFFSQNHWQLKGQ